MKRMFIIMLAMSLALFGSEAWEAIVMPNASFMMYCGEKMIAKGEQNRQEKQNDGQLDKMDELLGEERSEYYEAMVSVLDELEKSGSLKKNVKTFRLIDSFSAVKNAAVALEFKKPVELEALKSIPDAKVAISVDKIAGKEALSIEVKEPEKLRFAAVLVDDGKSMLLTGWDAAPAMVARIGKQASFTPEMKHVIGSVKGDFRLVLEITHQLKQKINEKAMSKMSEEPMQAMVFMKLAEMNGLLFDAVLEPEGVNVKIGLSSSNAQGAAVVKSQLFDGMVLPMAQGLADGIAPGKINTGSMFKTSVEGKNAILNIKLKNSELELIKGATM